MYTLGIYENRSMRLMGVIAAYDDRSAAERLKLSEAVASAGVRTVCLFRDTFPPLTVRCGLAEEWRWRTWNAAGGPGLKSAVGAGC